MPRDQTPDRALNGRIVILCDWLPPDFGAVGQYAIGFARELAAQGAKVTLVGFSSTGRSASTDRIEAGELTIRRLHRPVYDRSNFLQRASWTLRANLALVFGAWRELRRADEIRFTGSPPYLIHFVVPVAKLLGRRTRYRITDFHPECLIATLGKAPMWLRTLRAMTWYWRRKVDVIEVLGEDQRRRILAGGVAPERIELKRDPSPVAFSADQSPALAPPALREGRVILYSGNWGVAHDHETFVEGFGRFCARHPGVAGVWLNATGGRADVVEKALKDRGVPFLRTRPVPLEELPGVLLASDVHLITLDDRFVGYVLPSKVYACVASARPVLFIGSTESDVHLVARERPGDAYRQVNVGDPDGVVNALEALLGVRT